MHKSKKKHCWLTWFLEHRVTNGKSADRSQTACAIVHQKANWRAPTKNSKVPYVGDAV